MASDLPVISSGEFTATINPLGAELWSLRNGEGRELLTDADPRWWTGRAPILFPFVGRCRDDVYRLNGAQYPMPQHGFARRRHFALIDQSETQAVFRLGADAETLAIYPFAFSLEMSFHIEGQQLNMAARIANEGNIAMPFSFGFHPAFAWPLPYGAKVSEHRILFDEPEPAPLRDIEQQSGLIASTSKPSPVNGRQLNAAYEMFERDALIWDQLGSRGLLWGAPDSPNLRIAFPDMHWLGVWQKPVHIIFALSRGPAWRTRSTLPARFGINPAS